MHGISKWEEIESKRKWLQYAKKTKNAYKWKPNQMTGTFLDLSIIIYFIVIVCTDIWIPEVWIVANISGLFSNSNRTGVVLTDSSFPHLEN